MRHCCREMCAGKACADFDKCRGETVPPWQIVPSRSTALVAIREQDVLAAADALADQVLKSSRENCLVCLTTMDGPSCIECDWSVLAVMAFVYRRAREGKRS